MISRIRIEARAASMEQARYEIGILMDHVRMAGVLEGICPSSSWLGDEHFGHVRNLDRWSGVEDAQKQPLIYEGRMAISFDPELTVGGLRQHGFQVTQIEDEYHDGKTGDRVVDSSEKDVTDKVMVLHRVLPATREHVWERSSSFGSLEQEHEVGDLALFGRVQHDVIDEYEWTIWLRGITDGGKDLPTKVMGTVRRVDDEGTKPLLQYEQDIKPGQLAQTIVEEVGEKVRLFAQGMVAGSPR